MVESESSELELWRRIEAGSQDPDDYTDLMDLLFLANRDEEVSKLFDNALDLPLSNLQRAKLCAHRGWCDYAAGKNNERTVKLGQRALQLLSSETRGPEVLLWRGISHSLMAHATWWNDSTSAQKSARLGLDCLEQVMAESGSGETAQSSRENASRLYLLVSDTERAILCCKDCLEFDLHPLQRLSCLATLGNALRRSGRISEAEAVLTMAVQDREMEKNPQPGIYYELALVQRAKANSVEARQNLRRAVEVLRTKLSAYTQGGEAIEIYRNLGEVSYQIGDYAEAACAYQQVLARHPPESRYHWEAVVWLGFCYLKLKSYAQAQEFFEKVLASTVAASEGKSVARDGLHEAHHGLAQSLCESGKFKDALAEYEQILSLYPSDDPRRWNPILWLGFCNLRMAGPYGKARSYFEQVLASADASSEDKDSARDGLSEIDRAGPKLVWPS